MAWSQNRSTHIHHEMVAKAYRSEFGSCVAAESSRIRLGKIATGKREEEARRRLFVTFFQNVQDSHIITNVML